MIQIALLGLGTVGSGVVRLLELNGAEISKRLGQDIIVKRILVKDLCKRRAVPKGSILTDNISEILDDRDIDIIVELMGGEKPAVTYIREALGKGKHVVTANKEVIAKHGQELLKLSEENGVNLLFEASVAGGIPILKSMKESLCANVVTSVMGILNGTTNYILTQMAENGESFDAALKQAQEKGFAEADPTDDVMGFDAARKLAILSSIAFNSRVTPDKVFTCGINTIEQTDIEYAKEKGYVIKLVGVGSRVNDKVGVCVTPMFVKNDNMLSQVRGAYNAVMVKGNASGPLMFYGQGAGSMPTASAVAADIMDVVRHMDLCKNPCTCYNDFDIIDIRDQRTDLYVKFEVPSAGESTPIILKAIGKNKVRENTLKTEVSGDKYFIMMIASDLSFNDLEQIFALLRADIAEVKISNIIRVEEEQQIEG